MFGFCVKNSRGSRSRGFRFSSLISLIAMVLMLAATSPANAESIEEAIPGNSYTKYSPLLAIKCWENGAMVAHLQEPRSCETAELTDTKVVAVQEKVVFDSRRRLKQGRWSEIWTFNKCGKTVKVRVNLWSSGNYKADGEWVTLTN